MMKKLTNSPCEKFIELQETEPVEKADPFKKSCLLLSTQLFFLRGPQ
jgi:hypothetical protein